MSEYRIGDEVVIAVGSLEGATAVVEIVERRKRGRVWYWVRVDPFFSDSLAGRRLSYAGGELDTIDVIGLA